MDDPLTPAAPTPRSWTARLGLLGVYTALWIPFALCSGFLLIEDAAAIVVVMTCGIGLVFMPIPTGFVYYSAVGPAVLLMAARLRTWMVALIAVAGVALVAGLPAMWSWMAWDEAARAWTALDRTVALPQQPSQLRMVTFDGRVDEPGRALEILPCEETCQRLLYDAGLEAVEVFGWNRSTEEHLSITWRREVRDACPPAFDNERHALPATQRAIARGDCLVPSIGESLEGVPWFQRRQVSYSERKKQSKAWGVWDPQTVVRASAGPAGTPYDDAPWRRMEVRDKVITAPFYFYPKGGAELHMSLVAHRAQAVRGDASEEAIVREAFGIHLPALQDDLPETTLEDLEGLLDQPGEAVFDDALQAMFRDALARRSGRRSDPLTPTEAALIARILRDPRVTEAYYAVMIVERRVADHPDLVGALVDRVRMPVEDGMGHSVGRAARALAKRPPAEITPHQAALLQVLEGPITWWNAPILPGVIATGAFPRTALDAAFDANHRVPNEMAVLAICSSDDPGVVDYLDRVLAFGRSSDSTDARANAIRALRQHGRASDAESLFDGLEERDRKRLTRRLEEAPGRDPDGMCR